MSNTMPSTWKKIVVVSAVFGFSSIFTAALLFAAYSWYKSRPRPPAPWNNTAITATYDNVDTEGEQNTIVFSYTLENTMEFDYSVEKYSGLVILARLQEQGSLSGRKHDEKWFEIDYPVFIPSKERVRLPVHLKYSFQSREKPNPTREERRLHRKMLEQYINTQMSNLDGFVLFDETKRYHITLPSGWKESTGESLLPVKVRGKYGYVNYAGKLLIEPRFDDAEPFSDGLAAVLVGDKYGFISADGTIKIQPTFHFASSFSQGLAVVNTGGQHLFGTPASVPSNTGF